MNLRSEAFIATKEACRAVGAYESTAATDIIEAAMNRIVADAVAAERERCAAIVEEYSPDDVYYTDPDGNEYAGGVDWNQAKGALARRIREATP